MPRNPVCALLVGNKHFKSEVGPSSRKLGPWRDATERHMRRLAPPTVCFPEPHGTQSFLYDSSLKPRTKKPWAKNL